MKYKFYENELMKGEKIIDELIPSIINNIPIIFLGFLLLIMGIYYTIIGSNFTNIPFYILPLLIAIKIWMEQKYTQIAITNKRVIGSVGFISRDIIDIPLTKIETVKVKQGLMDRLFKIGKLLLIGVGGTMTNIPNIIEPEKSRKLLSKMIFEISETRK